MNDRRKDRFPGRPFLFHTPMRVRWFHATRADCIIILMTTLLLVEDTVELADAVERELALDGYRVLRAADGLTALKLCESEKPD